MPKIEIYVVSHKKYEKELPKEYKVLYVGAAVNKSIPENQINCLYDNTGENISEKNPQYCELTGLYWIWKHSDSEIVGLCHYRRFLSSMPFDKKLKHMLMSEDIEKRLNNHDIIVPYPLLQIRSNKAGYCLRHNKEDYDLTRDIIMQYTPEYIPSFDKVMNSHNLSKCNMFIAPKHVIDKYCRWLFSIYDAMEQKVDITGYDTYQKRVFGFMSERLFNVWILHNRLRVDHAYLSNIENSVLDDLLHR